MRHLSSKQNSVLSCLERIIVRYCTVKLHGKITGNRRLNNTGIQEIED